MNGYLLDTHVLLWWAEDQFSISEEARLAISSAYSSVFVSMVTAWEMSIKKRLGKLHSPMSAQDIIERGRLTALPISFAHTHVLETLPLLHRDPFDRMLVAQAQAEKLTLITRDSDILRYDIKSIVA